MDFTNFYKGFKRLLYVIVCLIGLSNLSFAKEIDDLKKQAESAISMTAKIDLSLQLVDTLVWIGKDYDSAREYVENIIEICETKNCEDSKWWAYGYLAELEMDEYNFELIKDIVLPKLKEHSLRSKEVEAYFEEIAGMYYLFNGNITESIENSKRAKNILEKKFPKSKRLGNVYYNLAFAHNMSGTNDLSISLMEKSIKQHEFLKDSLKWIESLTGLSTLYSTDGAYDKAIKLILESLEIVEEMGGAGVLDKYRLYDVLADLYIRNEDYLKAKEKLERVIPEFNALNLSYETKKNTCWSFNMSMSKVLGKLGEAERGLTYVDSSYVYARDINPFTERITDLRQAALTLKTGNYEQATIRLEKLLEAMKEFGNVDAFNAVLAGLFADLYIESNIPPNEKIWDELQLIVDRIIEKNKGQFNTDLLDAQKLSIVLGTYDVDPARVKKSLRSFSEIKDTIHSKEKLKVSNELLIAYETAEKEKQLEIKELALAKKIAERNIFIGAIVSLSFLMTILFLFFRQKNKYAITLEKEVAKRTADLEKTNIALKKSNDELERYAYIASHDLKEPLRNIMSFVNLIKRRDLVKNEDALVYFNFVEKGTEQMHNIVENLLEFSELRTKGIIIEDVEVQEISENVKETILERFEAKEINIKMSDILPKIQSNRESLFIIFKNLIENGIKYNESPEVEINVSYQYLNNMHQFKFEDNGIGIQEDYFDEIFTSFKRLHNHSKYDGSGTGLAICKYLIEQLKGMITVESEISEGTIFTVELPSLH